MSTREQAQDLALLEQAFEAEIRAALEDRPGPIQPRQVKRAERLCTEGLLTKCVQVWRGITIEGYALTHAGRMLYCSTCPDNPAED